MNRYLTRRTVRALVCAAALVPGASFVHAQFLTCQAPNLVLGQPNFADDSDNAGGLSAQSLNSATDVAVDPVSGKLFVLDRQNNRILRYGAPASLANFASAEGVLGQVNFASSTPGTTATTLETPIGFCFDSAGRLWVADSGNNRVLRFDNAATKADGAAADGVLGQADFVNDTGATSPSGMSGPADVFATADGTLWVADEANNRVLRFDNAAGKANGAAADGVLGQPSFVDDAAGLASTGMDNPTSLFVTPSGTLWVADDSNRRVLRFDAAATKPNGAPADSLFGQPDFGTGTDVTSRRATDSPLGVFQNAAGTLFILENDGDRVTYHLNAESKPAHSLADGVLGQLDFVEQSSSFEGSGLSLSQSVGLYFDEARQELWMADDGNNRVLRFGSPTNFVVNTAVDENDGIGTGGISLRDAVAAAVQLPNGAEITFASPVHNSVIRLNAAIGVTNATVRINGAGAGITVSGDTDNNGTPDTVLLAVVGTNSVCLLNDITLERGTLAFGGGLLANTGGRALLERCEVRHCVSGAGSLFALQGSEIIVYDSLVRRNAAGSGSAFAALGNSFGKFVNSTFTENLANSVQFGAPAVVADSNSELTMIHCTVVNNTNLASAAGGLIVVTNGYTVYNSIIVSNQSALGSFDVSVLPEVSMAAGFNLIRSGNSTSPFDLFSDAALGPLADNGGPLPTFALRPESGARNAALASQTAFFDISSDARGPGFPRVAGSAPDIGAYEALGQLVVTSNGTLTNGATLDFGSTPLGVSVPRTLTVSNAGAAALSFDPIGTPGGFSLMGPVPAELEPGSSATLELQLDAEAVGPTNGLFAIPHDGQDKPFEITLSGDVTPVGGGTGGSSAGSTSAGSTSAGGTTTAGSTSAGSTTGGGTSSGSTTAGGATAGGTGSGGGTNAVEILDWTIELKRPKEGKSVTFVAGKKGLGTLKGIVSETGLDPKTEGVQVQFAIVPVGVTNTGSVAAVTFEDVSKVGKVKKSGKIKFSAKKIGADLDLESGAEFQLWIRATEPDADFSVKTTKTNTFDFEIK